MDRLFFFKQGLSSLMDAASSVIGLKKAADSFVEVVDEALSDVKADIGFHLPSIDGAIYAGGASVLENLKAMGYTTIEVGSYNNGKVHYKTPEELKELARKAGIKISAAHLNHHPTEGPEGPEGPSETEGPNVVEEANIIKEQSADKQPNVAEATKAVEDAETGAGGVDGAGAMTEADKEWWQKALDIHKNLGCKYITTASLPESNDDSTIERYAKYLDSVAEMTAERGMKFCIHPVTAQLKCDEQTESIFEKLARATNKNKVWFEIDTLEALQAEVDVCQIIKQHDKRVLLLHLHDYDVTGDSGAIDFDKIIKQGSQCGVADIFIEVRDFRLPPMNCVERSFYYVENLPSVRY